MLTFLKRLFAFSVDWVVLFMVLAAPQFAVMLLTGRWFLDQDSSNIIQWAWVGLSVTLPSLAYFAVSDASRRGQTVGKRLTGIAVRSVDGSEMSWRQALLRNVVKLVPWEATHVMIFFPEPFDAEAMSVGKIGLMILSNVLLVVWLLVPLLDRRRFRAVHDRVGRTLVSGKTGG